MILLFLQFFFIFLHYYELKNINVIKVIIIIYRIIEKLIQIMICKCLLQVNLEQSAMEEILKFGEFSSLLNKSHSANSAEKNEDLASIENEGKLKEQEEDITDEGNEDKDKDANKDKDNYGCQVENGQDIV